MLLTTIIGCERNIVGTGPTDPFATLLGDSIVAPRTPIDSRVFFSFVENIARTGRTTTLYFKTERVYSPSGYRIIGSVTLQETHLHVRLDSIQAPELGGGITVPATTSFELGTLPNALYSMTVAINDTTVPGLFLITETAYVTKVQPNNLLATSRPTVLRVPHTIIWGQAESSSPPIYQSFLDSLAILGATSAQLSAGDYVYFSVHADGSFTIPSALGFAYGRYFLNRFAADTSVTRSLVKRFAKRYQDSIYVQLSGGRGERYYSTILRWEP
jgi:hypothetical protein